MSNERQHRESYEGDPSSQAPSGGGRSGQGGHGAGAAAGRPGDERPGIGWPREEMAFDPRWKSPRRAAFLSVVPGGGQLYIGYYMRGFAIAGAVLLFFALGASTRDLEPVGFFGALFTWFFGIIDAGRMAALYNHVAAGRETLELPEDLRMPGLGGSVAAGVVLVVFSGIALSNTLFGVSLRWLDEWWPVFPLALGVYLLGRGIWDQVDRQAAGRSEPARATE